MCEWGTDTPVNVKIAADLSHTGEAAWKVAGIDSCIAPIVEALQKGGIEMRASCCGHRKNVGRIDLQDGRVLLVMVPTTSQGGVNSSACSGVGEVTSKDGFSMNGVGQDVGAR